MLMIRGNGGMVATSMPQHGNASMPLDCQRYATRQGAKQGFLHLTKLLTFVDIC
jgi:hypothetical protein